MTGAQLRRYLAEKLKTKYPDKCECGGTLEYAADFGRVFVSCRKCSNYDPDAIAKCAGCEKEFNPALLIRGKCKDCQFKPLETPGP